MMVQYLLDVDEAVKIPDIKGQQSKFDDDVAPVKMALEQEKRVGEEIYSLFELARETKDYRAEQFMQWFVKEQVEEVELMRTICSTSSSARSDNMLLVEDFIAREALGEGDGGEAPPEAGAGWRPGPMSEGNRREPEQEPAADGISRRRLLGGAAAGAGGIAAGGRWSGAPVGRREGRQAPQGRRRRRRRPALPGSRRRRQVAARPGKSVAVLEARDRVGGRVHNLELEGGEKVEIGGQWVGPESGPGAGVDRRARAADLHDERRRQQRLLPRRHVQTYSGRSHPAARRRWSSSRPCSTGSTRWRPRFRATPRRPRPTRSSGTRRRSRPGSSPTCRRDEARELLDLAFSLGVRGRARRRLAAVHALLHGHRGRTSTT